MITLLASGFVLGVSVAAPLGPVSAAAIREGLERGGFGAFLIGLGAATVDFFYLGLVYVGVAPWLRGLPALMTAFYVAGALLLGQMAYSALRRAWAGGLPAPAAGRPGRSAYLFGLGITLFNPSTIASWLGLGVAFSGATLTGLSLGSAAAVLFSVFAGSAAWFATLALLVAGARRFAGQRPWVFRAVNLIAGLALLAYAVFFMLKAVGW
ncbi:MAG TPA: LysE family transporter [Symbiobacteriaceae bacterium]|nr:LysE family transporter [Symbiobacteriaceae bacterium]